MADSDEFSAVCMSREQAHAAAQRAYAHAQAMLANGETPRIACGPSVEPVSVKQRGLLHKGILPQIAAQARINGERFTEDVWKEFFRRMFVGANGWRWQVMRLPGQKRATPARFRVSTEELGRRDYAEFLDKVIAYASTELNVELEFTADERGLLRHKPKEKHEQDDDAAA